jgi:hypothetical protein
MEAAATTNASVDLMIKELLDMVDGEEVAHGGCGDHRCQRQLDDKGAFGHGRWRGDVRTSSQKYSEESTVKKVVVVQNKHASGLP